MGNRARNRLSLFAKSDLFAIMPKKSKTKKIAVIFCLTHNILVLEKIKYASLLLEIQDLLLVHWSCFLDQFISIFSTRNFSVKFQDLKISTRALLANYFETYCRTQNDVSRTQSDSK